MQTPVRTRVLIVDDSAVMRSLLRTVVTSDPTLEIAGTASDGASALQAVETLRPDLVLLDVEMPVMDGLSTLRRLRSQDQRLPIVMCSSLTLRGARVTIEALASGASDYVAKPAAQVSRESAFQQLADDLLPRIRALTAFRPPVPPTPASGHRNPFPFFSPSPQSPSAPPAVIVLGISTGGPAALDTLLPSLPPSFPVPVLVVQHMPELFTGMLAERLRTRCSLPVCEAIEGLAVRPGLISIARGDWHLEVRRPPHPAPHPVLHLAQSAPQNHCRPSVDVLLQSAAEVYGSRVLAVILTGMGSDGLAGCRKVRARGGAVFVQDQATSTVWGMPGAVFRAGLAQRVLPLENIAAEIQRATLPLPCEAPALRETVA